MIASLIGFKVCSDICIVSSVFYYILEIELCTQWHKLKSVVSILALLILAYVSFYSTSGSIKGMIMILVLMYVACM